MKNSIQTRFTFFVLALIGILLAVALSAAFSLVSVDRKFENVDQRWLASTSMLEELADRLSEFRLAESFRALAESDADRSQAERLATDHREAIAGILADYRHLNSDLAGADLKDITVTWSTYLSAHDAWVAKDGNGQQKDPARYASPIHALYLDVDKAVDKAIDLDTERAHADARAVDSSVHFTIAFVSVLSVCGLSIAFWLLYRARKTVLQPLSSMTEALSRLAGGERDVEVPALGRSDEVGLLASAFEVFRTNAVALEQAHYATRAAQEEAQAMARHDMLTGLPNRRLFGVEMERLLKRHTDTRAGLSLLMIDLDRFKPVNDTLGHSAGDAVLVEVAERLKTVLAKGDIVARLGGDEFAVLIDAPDTAGRTEAIAGYAQKILTAVSAPIQIGDNTVEIGASLGIAFAPSDASLAEDLMRSADLAMYSAKKDGRGRFRFFEPAMDEEMRLKAAMEADLKAAIASGQIQPFYQPLINMKRGDVYGFEMLARWKHPRLGDIRPDVFIPLAEQLGVISDLTWSLLSRALRDASAWDDTISLAINISPSQLNDPGFPLQLLAVINREGFDPSRLEVEVTESAFLSDIDTAREALTTLQSWGIKIALDDFGTGYSSLSHLRQLKFDKIKIDRSFVQTINENPENQKIVSAILSLADSLNLPTVAEGIETETIMKQLEDMGCELGQGYLFGKAIPAEATQQVLSAKEA